MANNERAHFHQWSLLGTLAFFLFVLWAASTITHASQSSFAYETARFHIQDNDTPADTPTVAPTTTPEVLLLIGHLTWQGISQPNSSNTGLTGTLTLCSSAVAHNYVVTTDASGFFTTPVALSSGLYEWWTKGRKSLSKNGTLILSGGITNVEFGTQKAGDANNNDVVNVGDFNILKNLFGKSIGQSGYDERADFNNSNNVNASDFNLQKGNFGISGATLICSGGP